MDPSLINKNVAFTSIARFFSLAFTFIYSILMIRLIGAEGNGVFSFLVANAQVAFLFLGINSSSSLAYYLAKGNFPREKVLGFTVFILGSATAVVAIVASVLFWFKASILSFFLPLGYQGIFYLLFFLFSFLAQTVMAFCNSYSIGNLFYKNLNQYTFFSSLAKFVLISGLFIGNRWSLISSDLELVLFLFIGVEVLSVLLFLLLLHIRKPIKINFNFSFQDFAKPFILYALKGWIMGLLAFFSGRFFNWVVTFYHSLKSLGFLALAVSLFNNVTMFFLPIFQALHPFLVKLPIDEGKERLLFYIRFTNSIAIISSLGCLLLCPYLLPLIFGQEFVASVLVTQVIFLSLPFFVFRSIGIMYASSQNKHHYMIVAESIAFVFTVIGDLIFIPLYEIEGAAWVMLFASIISCSIVAFYLVTKMNIPIFRNLFISIRDLKEIQKFIRTFLGQ